MLTRQAGFSRVMVGRRKEFGDLHDMLDDVRTAGGGPWAALVAGEAGIGKSRLLQEFTATLAPGLVTLSGQARESTADIPFALVRDSVTPHVSAWEGPPQALARLAQPLAEVLGPHARWYEPGVSGKRQVDDLAWVAVELLTHLIEPGPALIVLEDLHWADADSVAVFERLIAARPPALVVATVRPEDTRERALLGEALHRMRRTGALTVSTLQPLTVDELQELLEEICGDTVETAIAEILHERTRGNPYFVEELVLSASAALPQGQPVGPTAVVDASLPWDTTTVALARLRQLPAEATHVVRRAAVLGHEVPLHLLEELTHRHQVDVLSNVRRLVDIGVLVEESPDTLRFRHALTRDAVLASILMRDRRHLHQEAFRVLKASSSTPTAVLARHAAACGADDDATVYALEAAETALGEGAPRQAARLARLGLAHGSRPGLHAVVARASERIGHLDEASTHAQAWAAAAAAADDHIGAAEAWTLLAWVAWSGGETERAWRHLDAAEDAARRAGVPAATAPVMATRARVHLLAGATSTALEVAIEALDHSRAAGDNRSVAHVLATQGGALVSLSADEPERLDEARAVLLQARDLGRTEGDPSAIARALNNLLMPGTEVVQPAETRELLAEASAVANTYGLERFGAKVVALTVHHALVRGDRESAEAAFADRRLRHATPMEATFVASMEAHVAVEGDQISRARRLVGRWRARLPTLTVPEMVVFLATAEAYLASAAADAEAGERSLVRAGKVMGDLGSGAAADWWQIGLLALWSGVPPERLEALAEKYGPPPSRHYAGAFLHFHGSLHAAQGRVEEAITDLTGALAALQAGRPASMIVAARMQLAELLAGSGDLQAAREQASRAATELEGWPGHRQGALARLRRRLGDGPPSPLDLLTPRERDVVEFLVQGCSNGEIAERLYITRKTVATHVSNILSKTRLSRRGQVAAWALQHGVSRPGQRGPEAE